MKTISVGEVHELQKNGKARDLIDVRTAGEFEQVHAKGARLVPLGELDVKKVLAERAGGAEEPVYVICQSGMRSSRAYQKFIDAGFENVYNVQGGTSAWEKAGLPVEGKGGIGMGRVGMIFVGVMLVLFAVLGTNFGTTWRIVLAAASVPMFVRGITGMCPAGALIGRVACSMRK